MPFNEAYIYILKCKNCFTENSLFVGKELGRGLISCIFIICRLVWLLKEFYGFYGPIERSRGAYQDRLVAVLPRYAGKSREYNALSHLTDCPIPRRSRINHGQDRTPGHNISIL
jgi:hypothetical protein